MDKLKNYIIISLVFLILTGFCGLFVYLYIKERNKPANQIVSTVTVTKIDTLKYTDTLMYPIPVQVLKPIYDTIIDTVFVIQDYYRGKIYEYNYKDSNLCIKSNIIIHKNQLISLFNEYEIYRKTTTITNTIEVVKPPKLAFAIGTDVGAIIDSSRIKPLFFITASLQRQNSIYEFGYDPINRAVKIGYKYTLIYK